MTMRACEGSWTNNSEQADDLARQAVATPLSGRDERPQFLAGDPRRSECAYAQGAHLDYGADPPRPAENHSALRMPARIAPNRLRLHHRTTVPKHAVAAGIARRARASTGFSCAASICSIRSSRKWWSIIFETSVDVADFSHRSEQPVASDQADHAEQHRVGFSLRAAPRSAKTDETAMNWFQQNRFLGTFLVVFGLCTLAALYFLFSAKSSFNEAPARFERHASRR